MRSNKHTHFKPLAQLSFLHTEPISHFRQSSRALKAIATFEAFKGFVALAAASGMLLLVHRDLHELALLLVQHTHLNPAAKYPGIFIEAANHLQNSKLVLIAAGSAMYSVVRFVESYGLFRGARWAEAFAALSGAVYVPFEVAAFIRKPGWVELVVLAFNLATVVIVARSLLRKQQASRQPAA